MATKKNPAQDIPEKEEALQEGNDVNRDARIAELEAKLAAAEEQNAKVAELEERLAAAEALSARYRVGKDAETVEVASQQAIIEGKDPWDVMVSVRVPERRDTNEKSYWFMINGRSCQLPANNQYQTMRLPFAEALMRTLQAERFAQYFAENNIQVYDPKTNPNPEAKIMR